MLVLVLRELKVREEKHVQAVCILDFKVVYIALRLLHLLFRVLHRAFEHVDGLSEHSDVESILRGCH